MELLDRLRGLMRDSGLNENDVEAALVYRPTGEEHIEARMISLPAPEKIGEFVAKVMALEKPLFYGVLFAQVDHEAAAQGKPAGAAFVWPFMGGPKAEAALIGMRKLIADLLSKGGFAAIAN
jgi:hypothetical protein